jgi:hypothetical protein
LSKENPGTGQAKYAKQGIYCRICRVWLKKGERKANQFLCCNEDSRNLTICQKKYYKAKRDIAAMEKPAIDYGRLTCDTCGSDIKKQDAMQKRCITGIKGKSSECQKKAMRKYAANQYHAPPVKTRGKDNRLCLKCGEMFESEHVYNRICDNCRVSNDREARISHRFVQAGGHLNSDRSLCEVVDTLVEMR